MLRRSNVLAGSFGPVSNGDAYTVTTMDMAPPAQKIANP
jgi:hypothetical protein